MLPAVHERILFFDFMPTTLGTLGDLRPRFHLHTMPGVVFSDTSRRQVLKGADGIVFVADSQGGRREANVLSLADLAAGMAAHGLDLRATPLVIQYNKRDTPDAMPVAELDELLATIPCPRFEAIASTGVGVFDTLKAIAGAIVVRHRAESGDAPTG
ncbi:gliding-motility protein MglA [Nannocystis pusilla]|uniref:gliding-motility protein MglA n=1 Tax=Nannocystis pusilla TaxID=889268 RepID=UPI003DA2D35F